jgi:hypothetical protein
MYDYREEYIKDLQKENAELRLKLESALEDKNNFKELAKKYCLLYLEQFKRNLMGELK